MVEAGHQRSGRAKPRAARVLLALGLCALIGCEAERPAPQRSSFTGMTPVRTQTSEPKGGNSYSGGGGGGDDFFAPVGKGIESLFEERGDKNKSEWQIITPFGQKIRLPKEYSGQTVFRTREGRAYRLTFKDGVLIMIDDETKPSVSQLRPGAGVKPGTVGTVTAGSPGGTQGGAATPPAGGADDEGEVPRPTGPKPPLIGE